MRIKGPFCFCLLIFISYFSLWQSNPVFGCSDGNCPGQAQINWLASRQDPNADLVNSFEDGKDFAWTFDQAVAVIAFTHAGETQRAKRVLDKMKELQPSDCNASWNEWYRLADPCDMDWDWGSLKYVTGPIAWMVIAINYYESNTHDANYADMARKALCWLDTMVVTNPDGALRFCGGPRCGQYDAGEPNWISTEHNLDAYSAYYWRGMLDANDSYLYRASLILDYLRREMWAPSPDSDEPNELSNAVVFWEGFGNFAFSTDPQTWGVLSLGPRGPDGEEFYKSLDWLWYSPSGNTRTVQDYNNTIKDVNGFKSGTGETNNYIWVDGTEHAAAAFYSIGDNVKGDFFHNQMRRIVDTTGGLVHSFCQTDPNNIRWPENHRYNYVASAAWYYFNEVRINPFNLRPCSAECRAANINGTGRVNFLDYVILASNWLKTGLDLAGDINKDRRVQNVDLNILADYWLNDCYE